MPGKTQWTPAKKSRMAENYTKARKRDEERRAKSKDQNVAPGTFNGKTSGGYSLKPELIAKRQERKAARRAERAKKVAA